MATLLLSVTVWLARVCSAAGDTPFGARQDDVRPILDEPACMHGHTVAAGSANESCDCFFGWSGRRCDQRSEGEGDPAVRAAFMYLVYGSWHYMEELRPTLQALDKHFAWGMEYDVIIYHDRKFSADSLAEVASWTARRIRFVPVNIDEYPESMDASLRFAFDDPKHASTSCKFINSASYMHMSRFRYYTQFRLPLWKEYDYLFQMDSGMAFSRDLQCDPFQVMAASQAVFGHLTIDNTEPSVCMGPLRDWTWQYARRKGITPGHLHELEHARTAPSASFGQLNHSGPIGAQARATCTARP